MSSYYNSVASLLYWADEQKDEPLKPKLLSMSK